MRLNEKIDIEKILRELEDKLLRLEIIKLLYNL